MQTEVLFNVEEADEGGYVAAAALHGIVTEGDPIEELQARVRDAGVACHFDAAEKPKLIRLHFVQGRGACDVKLPRDLSGERLASAMVRVG